MGTLNATVRQLTRKEVVGEPHELAFWGVGLSCAGDFPPCIMNSQVQRLI